MPTLLQWLDEGVKMALEVHDDGSAVGEGGSAVLAAPFYEGSARALRMLQPEEARAGGIVDLEGTVGAYTMQAVVGWASDAGARKSSAIAAARALLAVTKQGNDGCPAAAQFVAAGLTVLQSTQLSLEDEELRAAVGSRVVAWSGAARKCDELGEGVRQRLDMLQQQ